MIAWWWCDVEWISWFPTPTTIVIPKPQWILFLQCGRMMMIIQFDGCKPAIHGLTGYMCHGWGSLAYPYIAIYSILNYTALKFNYYAMNSLSIHGSIHVICQWACQFLVDNRQDLGWAKYRLVSPRTNALKPHSIGLDHTAGFPILVVNRSKWDQIIPSMVLLGRQGDADL